MKKINIIITLFTTILLTSCGGGGGGGGGTSQPVPLSLTGVAATGLAIPSANVSVKCQTGSGTATTNAAGSYSVAISGGVPPCILEVTNPADSTKMHSVATGSGTSLVANLTPLTELVTARLLRQDPSTYFAALSAASLGTQITFAGITAAQADVVVALTGTVDTTAISNFISTPLLAATLASPTNGDVYDRLLDSIRTKLNSSQFIQIAALLTSGADASSVKNSVVKIVIEASTYSVGGTVTGLAGGKQAILQNNAGNAIVISANGAFTFSKPIIYNGSYSVTVAIQPTGQTCTIGSGTGSGMVVNVSSVTVTCSDVTFTVGGTVTGLIGGNKIILQNNAGNSTTINSNGIFVLSTSVSYNSNYAVTVSDQPNGPNCTIINGSGLNVVADIANVNILCNDILYENLGFAGSGAEGSKNGPGADATFNSPRGLAVDPLGNVYVADLWNNLIRKISPGGTVSTLAGSGPPCTSADRNNPMFYYGNICRYADVKDGVGTAATFYLPKAVTVDVYGNVYVADQANYLVRKISPLGVVETLAGSGQRGSQNGIGKSASFSAIYGIAVDGVGNIYVAEPDIGLIRKIAPDKTVSTFAEVTSKGVATDTYGNVFVADIINNSILKISPAGVISKLAGGVYPASTCKGQNGKLAFLCRNDGNGADATFNSPQDLAVDPLGNVYVADNYMIRRIYPSGDVRTIVGGDNNIYRNLPYPSGVAVDRNGIVYVTVENVVLKFVKGSCVNWICK